jgi:hypothetical protein
MRYGKMKRIDRTGKRRCGGANQGTGSNPSRPNRASAPCADTFYRLIRFPDHVPSYSWKSAFQFPKKTFCISATDERRMSRRRLPMNTRPGYLSLRYGDRPAGGAKGQAQNYKAKSRDVSDKNAVNLFQGRTTVKNNYIFKTLCLCSVY